MLIYFFAVDIPVHKVESMLPLAHTTIARYYGDLRDMVATVGRSFTMDGAVDDASDIIEVCFNKIYEIGHSSDYILSVFHQK